MKNYIKYEDNNSQWNQGYISVYINNTLIQHFSVDELEERLEEFDIEFYIYDFIDELKEKYNITEVIEESDASSWR